MKYFLIAALSAVGFSAMPASEAKAGVVIELGGPIILVDGGHRHHDRCDDRDWDNDHHHHHHDHDFNDNHNNHHHNH